MADTTDPNLLDLEALAPQSASIKLPNGQIVSVRPPRLKDTLKLSILGQQMKDVNMLNDEQLTVLDADIDKALVDMIPELSGIELSTPQKLGVITLLAEMGVPASTKDLKQQGIEVTGDPKDPIA